MFFDDFVEFYGCCSLMCDAVMAMTTAGTQLDPASVHGAHIFSGQIKVQAQLLKERLQVIQQRSLTRL